MAERAFKTQYEKAKRARLKQLSPTHKDNDKALTPQIVGSKKSPARCLTGKDIEELELAQRVFERRKRGYSLFEISDQMDINHVKCSELVKKYLAIYNESLRESTLQARDLELERLDDLTAKLYPMLESRNADGSIDYVARSQATDTLLKISKARREILGLDAANKLEVEVGQKGMRVYEGVNVQDI